MLSLPAKLSRYASAAALRALAPRLDVNATIREQSVPLMRRRMIKSASPGTVL